MLISDYVPSSGAIDCSVAEAKLVTMDVSAGSFTGVFGAAPSIIAAARRNRNRRRLLEGEGVYFSESVGLPLSNSSGDAIYKGQSLLGVEMEKIAFEHEEYRRLSSGTTLSNAVVCLELGDSIVFSVDNSNYPVYVKDSLSTPTMISTTRPSEISPSCLFLVVVSNYFCAYLRRSWVLCIPALIKFGYGHYCERRGIRFDLYYR